MIRDSTTGKPPARAARVLWPLTIFLAFIGIGVAVRRAGIILGLFSEPPRLGGFDAGFARHSLLTMVHIVPGMLFMALAPFQFVRTLRSRRPGWHRWAGRLVTGAGAVIGGTALVMSPQMAIGGVNETAATTLFALIFLFALGKGFRHIRRGEVALHREWMIRAFAVGLAVATIRPIVGVFFATSRLTHLTPHDFFGAAFWIGFTVQSIAAEVWINYTRPRTAAPARVVRERSGATQASRFVS